ncbi:MAG: putative type secretory pathway pullulanase [Holophagaceae bacterium]|nr:putative type secretory pathway pullulanase [Holophagaceae bacterium]
MRLSWRGATMKDLTHPIVEIDWQMPMLLLIATLIAIMCLSCGGGGGGGSTATTDYRTIDASTSSSPSADAAYYDVPSSELGAVVNGAQVTFNYWHPNATSVSVQLYSAWNDALGSPAATLAMTKGAHGIWSTGSVALPTQNYYVYKVGSSYVLDPYARSMAQWKHTSSSSISGDSIGKGAILDPDLTLPDGGWSAPTYFDGSAMKGTDGSTAAPYSYVSARDAIVYEAGVRDLTVDSSLVFPSHTWGTFKALVDMLPHIQKLGVTHIQLLCPLENYTYDQTQIGTREMGTALTSGANYNWGYDPQNYFTPTGMYSANPGDPAARINELKTLINEIHKQGMGVILDVVYNHTANNYVLTESNFWDYYYRSTSNNGAGSRDVRSDAKMTRKLIVDSIVQWVGDYHVDGFRFDLMGVLDTGTLQAAYAAATDLNPHTLFLGEGWTGFYSGGSTDYNGTSIAAADQTHVSAFSGQNVAMFSDSYRQIFKNGYPNDGATAFLTGQAQTATALFSNIAGTPTNAFAAPSPDNVINYLTCHDNLCLYDVLACATGLAKSDANDLVLLKRARTGYAILLSSQGVAFIHAGDEMFRTKETTAAYGAANTTSNAAHSRTFVSNSYNASDAINMVAWSRVYSDDPIGGGFTNYASSQNGYQLYAYTQGLIALRKSTNAFRLPGTNRSTKLSSLTLVGGGTSALAFGYKAISTDSTGTYYVFHNADTSAHGFTVDQSLTGAAVVVDATRAGTATLSSPVGLSLSGDGLTVTLDPLTSIIIKL